MTDNTSPSSPDIQIDVKTRFIKEQSKPEESRYVFAYTITLSNLGDHAAQLISRHWVITDANDQTQEVKGLGVIGEQPLLAPNESYTYTSGVVIATDTGTMTGSYQMRREDTDEAFDAQIPLFGLVVPSKLH